MAEYLNIIKAMKTLLFISSNKLSTVMTCNVVMYGIIVCFQLQVNPTHIHLDMPHHHQIVSASFLSKRII
jgi:hypothetical protein